MGKFILMKRILYTVGRLCIGEAVVIKLRYREGSSTSLIPEDPFNFFQDMNEIPCYSWNVSKFMFQ